MTDLPQLILKKKEERRLKAGHMWIFSNEVDTKRTPITALEPGQAVQVTDEKGKFIGYGYANPKSLICARLVSRDKSHPLSASLITHRIKIALSLRERLFSSPHYRLIYGEADALPGLVVDRFDDALVVQITTAGMEMMRDEIVACLDKVFKPVAIVLRNDSAIRQLEGLDNYVDTPLGQAPELLTVKENGATYQVPTFGSQKTGWFYDHRLNRHRAAQYVKDKRVLDVFSYMGGWSIPAALAGAAEVVCLDQSMPALEQLGDNAQLNGVVDRVSGLHGDAFDVMKVLREEGEKFDVIILDPPAFIPRKKDVAKGIDAYRRINQLAMQLLQRDGILVSASCSYHLQRDVLKSTVLKAARHLDRSATLLEQGHQGPDHPVHPAIPETDYLKSFTFRILPS